MESKVLHDLVSDRTETVATHAGYEVDQVTHSGGPPPSSSSSTSGGALGGFSCYPSCDEADESVPIYNAYNHHYFSWITGSDSEMYELESPTLMPNPTTTAFRTKENILHEYPTSIGNLSPPSLIYLCKGEHSAQSNPFTILELRCLSILLSSKSLQGKPGWRIPQELPRLPERLRPADPLSLKLDRGAHADRHPQPELLHYRPCRLPGVLHAADIPQQHDQPQ